MGVRVFLDSTLLENTPRGWDEAKISSKRKTSIKGLLTSYTTDLEFWGDGFSYIDGVMDVDYCDVIEVLIETDDCDEGNWTEEFLGIIQLTQISKYDVDKKIITTKILDNTFDARIDNNKSLKAFVDTSLSKNSVDIIPAQEIDIEVFDPDADYGTYLGDTRKMYRIHDCFRFIIDYMTDGGVAFASTLLSTDYYNWMVVTGEELRLGTGQGGTVEVSFKKLFSELNKKANVSFAIEPTSDGYSEQFLLRLEETSFFEQDDELVTLSNVKDVEMSYNKDQLFSDVDIGSKSDFDEIVLSYPAFNFKTFLEENYTILGQCNIDKTLNLVSSYLIDSNTVQDCAINLEEKYDKKNFIIITDGEKAIKYKAYGEPISTGTNDSLGVNQLFDSSATFITDGVSVGDRVSNLTTGEFANINNVVDDDELNLNDDIFTTMGDDYAIEAGPFSYNDPINNINVINRFTGGLPNSVIKHTATSSTAKFQASFSNIGVGGVPDIVPFSVDPIPYDDDSTPPNFDDGGNFNTTTHKYEVPTTGLYTFESSLLLSTIANTSATNVVVNGKFTSSPRGANWNIDAVSSNNSVFTASYEGSIGYAMFNPNPTAYLRQYYDLNPFTSYRLKFRARLDEFVVDGGFCTISVNGFSPIVVDRKDKWITFEVELNYTKTASPPNFFEFRYPRRGAAVHLRDIEMFEGTTNSIDLYIVRESKSGDVIEEFNTNKILPHRINETSKSDEIINSKSFSVFQGEKVYCRFDASKISGIDSSDLMFYQSFFRNSNIDDGGGDLTAIDTNDFPIYRYRFNKALSFEMFKELNDNPEKAVLFSKNTGQYIFGWRNSLKYDRKTGVCEFDLRSKEKIT